MTHYKLTSTVILRLSTANEVLGDMDLSGNMTRQVEQDIPVMDDSSHIVNVGKLVEDMELKMRNLLRAYSKSLFSTFLLKYPYLDKMADGVTEEVYFGKAKDVVGDLRSELAFRQIERSRLILWRHPNTIRNK